MPQTELRGPFGFALIVDLGATAVLRLKQQAALALTSLGAFFPTDSPSFHPMPRIMASPNADTGIASYASRLASCKRSVLCQWAPLLPSQALLCSFPTSTMPVQKAKTDMASYVSHLAPSMRHIPPNQASALQWMLGFVPCTTSCSTSRTRAFNQAIAADGCTKMMQ